MDEAQRQPDIWAYGSNSFGKLHESMNILNIVNIVSHLDQNIHYIHNIHLLNTGTDAEPWVAP